MSKTYTLYDLRKNILHTGDFKTFHDCLNSAINEKISLQGADLRYKNLSNMTLDNINLSYASLKGANLTGANLSEITAHKTCLDQTDLYNTCLAESTLSHCTFNHSNFGGTLISSARFDHCSFTGRSWLELNFETSKRIKQCKGRLEDKQNFQNFCAPPLIVKGLGTPRLITNEQDKRALQGSLQKTKTLYQSTS